MEGLQSNGFGNWTDIAALVGTKNKEDCELHYINVRTFLTQFWLNNIKNLDQLEASVDKLQKEGKLDTDAIKKLMTDSIKSNLEKDSKTLIQQKLEKYQNKINEAREREKSDQGYNGILGYMPLRRDFDVEYDNEVELFLAEMEFNEEDDENEVTLKKKILEIYNKRLDEREKRKNFVIDRGLLDLKKQSQLERSRTPEEKEIHNLMKFFARFQTEEEHNKLVQNIIKERNLRQRIEELKSFKKLNMRTFEEVENFMLEKRKEDQNYNKQAENLKNIYSKDSSKYNKRANRLNKEVEEYKNNKTSMSDLENSLCSNLAMKPHEYLLMKELLVRESVSQGFLSRDLASQIFDLKRTDKNKIMEVFDFLVTHNLIIEK